MTQAPNGWMFIRKEWQPILEEIDRRAGKEGGRDNDFFVEVLAEDYSAADDADRIARPPTLAERQHKELVEQLTIIARWKSPASRLRALNVTLDRVHEGRCIECGEPIIDAADDAHICFECHDEEEE